MRSKRTAFALVMVAFSFASCAARERSTLFRQQVVGTLGATIHGGITLSPQGVLSVHLRTTKEEPVRPT
jgi:hypothetical protein